MASSKVSVGPFKLVIGGDGIAVATFDRPPVNAVTLEVYDAIAELAAQIKDSEEVRAVVLSAPPDARAWCGGADLNEFVGMTPERRQWRYDRINERIPDLYALDRPTIAAINAHAVGIGVVLSAVCDMRVAADDATFACREIDYGLVPGEGRLLESLGVPRAVVREMLFTARRFTAEEMQRAGFLNAVVPRAQVLAKARELAGQAAGKSLPSLRISKRSFNAAEGLEWMEAYALCQRASTQLTSGVDAQEGVHAFLEHRPPKLIDR